MIPHQGANTSSCGPIPSSRPQIQWSSRWGAITQDPQNRIMGAAADQKSKRLAVKEAIASCESRGGHACVLLSTYSDLCIVTIQGEKGTNDATAKSIEDATELGMEACSRRGDSDCHVYYKACSLPVRVQ
ncbi:DUF4189 domain-containing protein [Lysobacter sp. CA199]|uniref:DUF4189 domain-containing protein n=1 Tax=Lysobacter sp. CA199 TaxID=3455608 RepID=UPI003F8D86F5